MTENTIRLLEVGDRVKDNDPRMVDRGVLTVTQVASDQYGRQTHVWVGISKFDPRPSRISRERIHVDGKPRRSGFSLVEDEA